MSQCTFRVAAGVLVGVGCLQLTGDLLGALPLKALGAASHASPAPKVFTAHEGLETFSARFVIGWHDSAGVPKNVELTPKLNNRIRGPYNRRNPFGAALAGAPMLSASPQLAPMHQAMLRHTFCRRENLLAEIGITQALPPFTLDILLRRPPVRQTAPWQLHYEVTCPAV
jgi:hypothetical protein